MEDPTNDMVIRIINLIGQIVKRKDQINGKNTFDVTALEKGFYFIQIISIMNNLSKTHMILTER